MAYFSVLVLMFIMVGGSCIERSDATIIHNATTEKKTADPKPTIVAYSTTNATSTAATTRASAGDASVPGYLMFSRASNHTHRGHHLSVEFTYVVSSAFLLIIVVGVSCNILLIYTIASVSKLHSYMLTPSFTGGVVACGLMHTVFLDFLPSQVLALILVTAERYISIVFSIRRKGIVTKRRVIGAIIVSRVYTLLVGLFPIISDKHSVRIIHGVCLLMFPISYQTFQVAFNFIIPICFFLYVYARIFRIARERANKTAKMIKSLGILEESERLTTSDDGIKYHAEGEQIQGIGKCNQSSKKMEAAEKKKHQSVLSMSRNTRASRHIAALVSVCVICWLFYILTVFINYNCLCLSREFTWIVNIINYSSTAINPVLYGLLNTTIRKEARKKLQKLWSHCVNQFPGST